MIEIPALHFIWGAMLMFWFGTWAAYDSPKNISAAVLKLLGALLAATGILLLGIWIGSR